MKGLENINVNLEVFLGETLLSVEEIVKLDKGSIIELNQDVSSDSKFTIGKAEIGLAEIMVYDKNFSIKVKSISQNKG